MKNIKTSLQNWFNKNSSVFARNDLGYDDIAISGLPSEYDNVPYETVIYGKTVHTVGEYKAEVSKMVNDHI